MPRRSSKIIVSKFVGGTCLFSDLVLRVLGVVRFYTMYQVFVSITTGPSVTAGSRDLVASWWQRSEAAKAALRILLQAGKVSLEASGMQDDLESSRLAIIPADRSDSCITVTVQRKIVVSRFVCLFVGWLIQ